MKILIRKKEIITLINKNKINTIITTLIRKIKIFLKTKYNLNVKTSEISKVFMKTKREKLKKNIFKIINNIKLFIILKK